MMRRRSPLALLFAAVVAVVPVAISCAKAGPCEKNSDCPVGQYCGAAGGCLVNCSDSVRDCPKASVCNQNGQCEPANGDGGPPDGGKPGGAIPDGGQPDTSPDPDASQPDSAMVGTGRTLDSCNQTNDCQNGLVCKPLYVGGPNRCTPNCNTDAQCMSAGRCLTVKADTYCLMGDTGRACSSATDCNYACITPGSYCTVACNSGADCPNGYGCTTISNQKVCVRAEEYCGMGGKTCSSLKCDNSILASGCTLSCASPSDCPQRASVLAKWTCQSGNCMRPSDVVGPLGQGVAAEYACNQQNQVVNLCNDAQHIDFDKFSIPNPPVLSCPSSVSVAGVAGDSCADTCRYAGGCAFGYECAGVANLQSQRSGLCLPALGNLEVGQSCTKDGECAFGYCSGGKCSRDCSGDGLCPTGSTCTAVGGQFPSVEGVAFKRCQ